MNPLLQLIELVRTHQPAIARPRADDESFILTLGSVQFKTRPDSNFTRLRDENEIDTLEIDSFVLAQSVRNRWQEQNAIDLTAQTADRDRKILKAIDEIKNPKPKPHPFDSVVNPSLG